MHQQLLKFALLLLLVPHILAACETSEEPASSAATPTLIMPTTVGSDGSNVTTSNNSATAVSDTTAYPGPNTDANTTDSINEQAQSAPLPTRTPAPTPTSSPLVEAVIAPPLPPSSRDLLFIADGTLKRWRHTNQQVETLLPGGTTTEDEPPRQRDQPLARDITLYDVSDNGRIAVAGRLTSPRLTDIEGESEEEAQPSTYEVIRLNLEDGSSQVIVPRLFALTTIVLSDDGSQAALIGANASDPTTAASIYLLNVNEGTLRQVDRCDTACSKTVVWHIDNSFITWADAQGLWLFNLIGSEPQRLLETADGGIEAYAPLAWANNGRHLLLWQTQEGLIAERAVFDVPTNTVLRIPESSAATSQPTEIRWMPDDRLLILHATPPRMELWRVQVEQNQVIREETLTLADTGYATGSLHQENGRFAYTLIAANNETIAGLYHLTSLAETPERISVMLPFRDAPTVTWSPDGFGAIITHTQEDLLLYTYNNGNPDAPSLLYDLQSIAGQQAHSFHWLPN